MAPLFADAIAWKAGARQSSDHTDKMKILPVLALASAHAYTVFEVDAVCDLAATPAVECGLNEWCTADMKVS